MLGFAIAHCEFRLLIVFIHRELHKYLVTISQLLVLPILSVYPFLKYLLFYYIVIINVKNMMIIIISVRMIKVSVLI